MTLTEAQKTIIVELWPNCVVQSGNQLRHVTFHNGTKCVSHLGVIEDIDR